MESEIATQMILHAGGVPVPEVWIPHTDNHPGILGSSGHRDVSALFTSVNEFDYFFISSLEGYTCAAPLASNPASYPSADLIISSLANALVKVSALTFPAIGSFCLCRNSSEETVVVGPMMNTDFLLRSPPYFLGPFKTARSRYLCQIDHVLNAIVSGSQYTDNPVSGYLYHLQIREWVSSDPSLATEDAEFFVRHADDKGDHILVNDQGQVTGIVDWEWAFTTTKADAFSAPFALIDVGRYYEGSNELSEHERMLADAFDRLNRPDLTACVYGGRKYHRLLHCIGGTPDTVMLHALGEAMSAAPLPSLSLDCWVDAAREHFQADQGLQAILARSTRRY